MPETVPSIRALAKRLGRSHTAVSRWTRHVEWSFGPPPWPASVVPDVIQWAGTYLRDDCRAEAEDLRDRGADADVLDPDARRRVLDLTGDPTLTTRSAVRAEAERLRRAADADEAALAAEGSE